MSCICLHCTFPYMYLSAIVYQLFYSHSITCVQGMGKFRLSVHQKNEIRKRYGLLYCVSIPRHLISMTIPSEILPYTVSLPLSLFSKAPVSSLSLLRKCILEMKLLPQGNWVVLCIYMFTNVVIRSYNSLYRMD